MIKIKLEITTGYVTAGHIDYIEVEDDFFHDMSEEQKKQEIHEMAIEFMHEKIECFGEIVDD